MKPVSSSDRNLTILLVVAVVGVFAFLVFRILSSSAPSGITPEVLHADSPAPIAAATGKVSQASDGVIDVTTPPNAGLIDPFRTVAATNPPRPVARRVRRRPFIDPMVGPLLPTVGSDVPTEEPKLIGVMSGNPPIGVFSVGYKEEILRAGDTLSNGFTVQSIGSQAAILVNKKTKIRLSISPPK